MSETPIFSEASISAIRELDDRTRLEILCAISGDAIGEIEENVFADDPKNWRSAFWWCYLSIVGQFFAQQGGLFSEKGQEAVDAEALRDSLLRELEQPGSSSSLQARRFAAKLRQLLQAFGGGAEDEIEALIRDACSTYCEAARAGSF